MSRAADDSADDMRSANAAPGNGAAGAAAALARPLSPGLLMWRQFRRHRVALLGLGVILAFVVLALSAELISPYPISERHEGLEYAPPTRIRLRDFRGSLRAPFVYGMEKQFDRENWRTTYVPETTTPYPVRLFVKGAPYRLLGLVPWDVHLFGTDGGFVFLLGADQLGRDLFSRTIYASRISLSIAILGVVMSIAFGVLLGSVSGYFGGAVDNVIQRIIEVLLAIPNIPLWMALAAAIPADWPVVRVYIGIVLILSLIGWTGTARVVRGKFMSLRGEEFVLASRSFGASALHIIWKHLIPNFMSYIIVNLSLSIPNMILTETSLSFLGLGLQAPAVSWGVLLKNAQNFQDIVLHPWILSPGAFVVVAILALNFLGDGIRDAADPFSHRSG